MPGRSRTLLGSVDLGERSVPYRLVQVARRRRIQLLVGEDGALQVRTPLRCSVAVAERAIRAHAAWALQALEHAAAARSRPALAPGSLLPLLDERLLLQIADAPRPQVVRRGEALCVAGPGLSAAGVSALLERWYRGQARQLFAARIQHYAPSIGVSPARLVIRGQRSRWGSCSATGTVSLNWRLLLTASRLLDYVVVHELCHLRHLNHSAAFWTLVERVVPDWRERRNALRALQPRRLL